MSSMRPSRPAVCAEDRGIKLSFKCSMRLSRHTVDAEDRGIKPSLDGSSMRPSRRTVDAGDRGIEHLLAAAAAANCRVCIKTLAIVDNFEP